MSPRIYSNERELKVGTILSLSKAASHHLCHVLRLTRGCDLILFNGDGNDYGATLVTDGKTASVEVLRVIPNETESNLSVHLIQGISRGDRMDTTLQKAVELGVTEITPLLTSKTAVKITPERLGSKMKHWHNIVTGACEQCQRSVIPALHEPVKFQPWLSDLDHNDGVVSIVLAPDSRTTLAGIELNQTQACRLLIGPESGLSPQEIDNCVAHGFNAASLGPRILRTETAGPAAIAILQAKFGDLR